MKYAPRKVYIKESSGYVELSYKDFCRRRQTDQSYMDKLFIPVQGCLLEVMREQYTEFYKDKERWRYLKKLDTNHSLLSLEGFTDSEGNVLDFIIDETVDVAETVVCAVMVDRLKVALPLLSDGEQALVKAIFFEELSEREVGLRLGITQSVVNKRKAKILAKLRTIIENYILWRSAPLVFSFGKMRGRFLSSLNLGFTKIPIGGKSMAYNHGREDRKWRIWKEAEEKVLRECGVNETVIEQIRTDDRADFNSNRRFYRWASDFGEYLEEMERGEKQAEIRTVTDLLDEIESETLYLALVTVDRRTLQIVLLKMQGYSTKEIAPLVHLTAGAVYARLAHLRKKLRKIL